MPAAARIGDLSNHPGGAITGPPLVTNVEIEGSPAAVLGDRHVCATPQPPAHLNTSAIVGGSGTVFIGGFAAARVNDGAACGASITAGAVTVEIG
jgi:uncharacterized Zn-binding protein involved in type VI secretion